MNVRELLARIAELEATLAATAPCKTCDGKGFTEEIDAGDDGATVSFAAPCPQCTTADAPPEVTEEMMVASEKPLLMAGDAEYLRGLSVGGSHLVSAKWLCDFARRIENTLAAAQPDAAHEGGS